MAIKRPVAIALLLCSLLNGCFSYAAVQSTPGRAARVRVQLASPADFRLAEFTANEVVVADGEMVRADEQELVMSVLRLQARSGYEFVGRGETITIPRSNIVSLQRKRIAPLQSALLAGAVVAIVVLTTRIFDAVSTGGEGGEKPPPPPS
jgi:hypothetical protein